MTPSSPVEPPPAGAYIHHGSTTELRLFPMVIVMLLRRIGSMMVAAATVAVLTSVLFISLAWAERPSPAPQPVDNPHSLLQLPEAGDDVGEYLRLPVPRPPGTLKELAVTDDQVCALTHDGLLYCWQFGTDDASSTFTGLLVAVTAGSEHFCGIDSSSRAVCWGDPIAARQIPDPPLADIAAGNTHSCAVDTTGIPVCWGRNLDAGHRNPPEGPFRHIDAGGDVTCASGPRDATKCWGRTTLPNEPFDRPIRQLSVSSNAVCGIDGTNRPLCEFAAEATPIHPPAAIATDIAAGSHFVCTLDTTGRLACDGPNAPALPETPPVAETIAAAEHTVCAITAWQGIRCWDDTGEVLGE